MSKTTIDFRGAVINSINRSKPIETYEDRKRRQERTKVKDDAIRISESFVRERICSSPRLLK